MTTTRILHYDGSIARIAIKMDNHVHEMETARIHPGRYIRVDRGSRDWPQLCEGARLQGNTLVAAAREADIATQLARDCHCKQIASREIYDRTVAGWKAVFA